MNDQVASTSKIPLPYEKIGLFFFSKIHLKIKKGSYTHILLLIPK
jgi:hypothetical protein